MTRSVALVASFGLESGNSAASQPTESLRPLYMLGVAGGMMSATMQEEPPDLHWPARRFDLKEYVDNV